MKLIITSSNEFVYEILAKYKRTSIGDIEFISIGDLN
jgi:hypothetical protein